MTHFPNKYYLFFINHPPWATFILLITAEKDLKCDKGTEKGKRIGLSSKATFRVLF